MKKIFLFLMVSVMNVVCMEKTNPYMHVYTVPMKFPLHELAEAGDYNMVQKLLDAGHSVDCEHDSDGHQPLAWAAAAGHTDVMRLLLDNGADVNHRGDQGCCERSALHEAFMCGKLDAVDVLLEYGADMNIRNEANATVLHHSIDSDHDIANARYALEKALEHGVLAELLAARDSSGETALDWARDFHKDNPALVAEFEQMFTEYENKI